MLRSKRDADADFGRALGDDLGKHAEETYASEHQRQHRECKYEHRVKTGVQCGLPDAPLRLDFLNHQIDCSGKSFPMRGFLIEVLAAGRRQRVELRLASGSAFRPFGANPSLLFKTMKRRVE